MRLCAALPKGVAQDRFHVTGGVAPAGLAAAGSAGSGAVCAFRLAAADCRAIAAASSAAAGDGGAGAAAPVATTGAGAGVASATGGAVAAAAVTGAAWGDALHSSSTPAGVSEKLRARTGNSASLALIARVSSPSAMSHDPGDCRSAAWLLANLVEKS